MPPKPWLIKAGPPREDVSAIIQSNPTMKQQIPKLSAQMPFTGPQTAQQSMNPNSTGINTPTTNPTTNGFGTTGLGTTSAYGSYGSGIGSSLGGGYGSSYGGMSGYGSSYGGGYGSSMYGGGYGSSMYGGGGYGSSMYGMGGGYGRMGMMTGGDPNKPNMVMNTLMTLQSLGFLIGSFCEIGRSLDHNIQGLHLFFNSFKNLFKKIYEGIKSMGSWLGQKTKNLLMTVLNFIKTYVLCMNHEDSKNKMKSLKIVINVCVVVLVFTLYPQFKKAIAKAA